MPRFSPIPIATQDFLHEDLPIKDQQYACISIISPEDVLVRKDAYATTKFLTTLTVTLNDMLAELEQQVPEAAAKIAGFKERHGHWLSAGATTDAFNAFIQDRGADIDKQYSDEHGGVCCTRGIKVRGCYATLEAAKGRCQILRAEDPIHDVYVAEVGKWCPFSASAAAMQDVNYAESELNALMAGYKENAESKAVEFAEQTNARVAIAKEEGQAGKLAAGSEASGSGRNDPSITATVVDVSDIPKEMFDAPGDAHESAAAEATKAAAVKKRVVRKTEAKPTAKATAGPRVAKKAAVPRKKAAAVTESAPDAAPQ